MLSAETRAAAVKWSCIVGVFAYPVVWAALALGQPPDLRAAMPKDQLALIEKIDAHKQLRRDAKAERNGLRRAEADRKVKESGRELEADLTRKLQGDGIKGWVVVLESDGRFNYVFSVPGYLTILMDLKTMPEAAKQALRSAAKNDRLVVTIQTRVSPQVKAVPDGTPAVLFAELEGSSLKASARAKD